LEGIASALNARGVSSARGGRWHPGTVSRVLQRVRDLRGTVVQSAA
jgi:hypothetical protein